VQEDARYRCGYCLTSQRLTAMPMHFEHILPRAAGGTSDEENLWLACPLCNGYKGIRTHYPDPETGEETVYSIHADKYGTNTFGGVIMGWKLLVLRPVVARRLLHLDSITSISPAPGAAGYWLVGIHPHVEMACYADLMCHAGHLKPHPILALQITDNVLHFLPGYDAPAHKARRISGSRRHGTLCCWQQYATRDSLESTVRIAASLVRPPHHNDWWRDCGAFAIPGHFS
jgi:hypothetical protein